MAMPAPLPFCRLVALYLRRGMPLGYSLRRAWEVSRAA